jgi:N-acetylglutamate synthase-like GNAT family acetyltransferase
MEKRPAVSIRKATQADAKGILECLAAAFEPFREQYTPAAFLDTILTSETVQQRLASMDVFVAECDGIIVGTIAGSAHGPEEGHIRGMAVRPAWQGAGVAEQLLKIVEVALRGMPCKRISLDTTAPLMRATRFYGKNGFQRSGKVSDFFGMPLIEFVKNCGAD